MQIKKLFKYIPITIMTVGVILAAFVNPPYFLNNSGTSGTQTFNDNQQVNDADYTDQLDHIRSDVAKQDGMTNPVKSIELANTEFSTSDSTAAIVTKMDGSTLLYTWGDNGYGQLGLNDTGRRPIPTQVSPFSSSPISQIAFGSYHSAALLEDGSLYTWGSNNFGQLGFKDMERRLIPTQVTFFNGKKITQIALGFSHSAALLEDGSLYTWGANDLRQLGLDNKDETITPTPTQVTFFNGKKITQIALGGNHSAALLEDGSLYTWGDNASGQLGLGGYNDTLTPTQVSPFSSSPITQIAFGSNHSAALLENGSLYTWGFNSYGQLGFDNKGGTPTPTQVKTLSGLPITQIAFGNNHSAALLENGILYTWGHNNNGQLGLDDKANKPTPTPVTSFNGKKITQIAFGYNHSAALLEDGSLYTWGDNGLGQLGLASKNDTVTPTWMPYLGKDSHITAKDTITAEQAVDSFWVNGTLNQVGFKNSFNLINIPEVADQEITMDTKPTYDNSIGTVTMKVKFKYFYDENGLVVADTSTTTMTINGFKPYYYTTSIAALSEYSHSVVVDKWKQAVTVDNKLNYNELKKYLDLSTVPTTAEFEIRNENINFKTGVLTFDITTTQVFDNNDDIIDTPADFDPFPITLKLTARITEMSAKASTSSLTAAELKAKLFSEDGSVKDPSELEKYMSVVAPVDGVKYSLIADTWNSNPADGTLAFTIYADKYYDDEGSEQLGSATNVDSQLPFNLSLQPEASSIAIRPDMPDVRVDQFEAYVKSNGIVVRSKLQEFLSLTNVPNDATFTITDIDIDEYNANFERNHLTFKLTINKYNQGIPATPQPYSEVFELTLSTQHAPTIMSAKAKGEYDANISVMQFFRAFTDASNNVTNRNFLEQYINIQSLPAGAILSIESPEVSQEAGQVKFSIKSDQAYNEESNLFSGFTSSLFTLDLLAKKQAPVITVNPNIVDPIKAEEFVQEVNNLSGDKALTSYLFDQYLKFTGDVPPETVYFVQRAVADHSTGEVDLEIYPSRYYDANDDIQTGTSPTNVTKLALQLKASPSRIEIKAGYPTELRVDQFVKTLQPNGTSVSRSDLEKYFNLTNIPDTAVFSITNDKLPPDYINGIKKTISFDLNTTIYNDADGVSGANTQPFSLVLAEQHEPTRITLKEAYDHALKVVDVESKLKALSGQELVNYLNNFLDIQSIPTTADITVDVTPTIPGTDKLSFEVKLPKIYDANSDLVDSTPGQFKFTLELEAIYPPTNIMINQSYTKVRIDQFASQIMRFKGQDLYDYLVPNYLTVTSIYAPAKLAARITAQDNQTGKLTISITIAAYYDNDSNLVHDSKTYDFEYVMTPKYQPTMISLLATYPVDLTPTNFKEQLEKGGAVVAGDQYTLSETNISFLKKFLKLAAVPADTIYTLNINSDQTDDATGVLSFKLSLNQYYSSDGDLKIEPYDNPFILNLLPASTDPEYAQTQITSKADAPSIKSAQSFLETIYTNGSLNTNQLSLYVNGLNTIPSEGSITNIVSKQVAGSQAIFTLTVDRFYNNNGKLDDNAKSYDFSLTLTPKYSPTQISVLAPSVYPTDYTPSEFQAKITSNAVAVDGNTYTLSEANLLFLAKFLVFSSVPPSTVYQLTINQADNATGAFSFNLFINQYYDANGELVTNANQPYNDLVLQLGVAVLEPEIKPATNLIDKKQSAPSVDAVWNLIKDSNGNLVFSQLSKYVGGLNSIPTDASVVVDENPSVNESEAKFKIIFDAYYDGSSRTMITGEKTFTFTVTLDYIPTPVESNTFPWWWILVGIGSAAIIGALVWLLIKKQNERQLAAKRILQQRSAEQAK